MGCCAQDAAHREGARRNRCSNPRARSREVRVRKNVSSDRESIEVPTRHEEVSVERVLHSGETSEVEIGEDEEVVPVELYEIGEASYFDVGTATLESPWPPTTTCQR